MPSRRTGDRLKRRYLLLLLAVMLPVAATGSSPAADAPAPLPSAVARAPIALLVDLSAGQTLYARDAERRFLPASMTKAMSTLIAFDLIAAGKLDENAVVTVRPETAARWAGKGTTLNLRANERVAVRDLLRGMTTVSANDAAVALAEAALGSTDAWLAAMNSRARALGMNGSHFATPNGFPDHGHTYVTARDLVRLAEALITDHPALYRAYVGQQAMDWRGQRMASHDPFAGVLPGADGIKTGHTFEAGFNFLGSAARGGRRLVLVVAGVDTEPARAQAAKALAEWGFTAWDSRAWLQPGMVLGRVRVQQGAARSLPVTVPRGYALTFARGAPPQVAARIVYDGPVRAPVAKGTEVARLEVRIAGQVPYNLPLVAKQAVERAGPIDRLTNGLLGLFE